MNSNADKASSNTFIVMAVCAVALNVAVVYWITHFEKEFMRELIGPYIFHVAVTWAAFRMGMSGFTDVDDTRYSDTEYQYEVGRDGVRKWIYSRTRPCAVAILYPNLDGSLRLSNST